MLPPMTGSLALMFAYDHLSEHCIQTSLHRSTATSLAVLRALLESRSALSCAVHGLLRAPGPLYGILSFRYTTREQRIERFAHLSSMAFSLAFALREPAACALQ